MPNMSLFHSKNTKLEIFLRKHLFAKGYRYRINDKRLKGRPDIVFPKYRAVIFVHGCFWHAHEGCERFSIPKTNKLFWLEKFTQNRERDSAVVSLLEQQGWRVLVIWECAVRSRAAFSLDDLIDFISCWLEGEGHSCQVGGKDPLPRIEMSIDLIKPIARN